MNGYRIFVRKPFIKRLLGRPKEALRDQCMMDILEMGIKKGSDSLILSMAWNLRVILPGKYTCHIA
jgi:hypothetical protein